MKIKNSIILLAIVSLLCGCVSRPVIKKSADFQMASVQSILDRSEAPAEKTNAAPSAETEKPDEPVLPVKNLDAPVEIQTTEKVVEEVIQPVTETYKYRVDWLKIPVGYVTFEIKDGQKFEGRNIYLVSMYVKTNAFASKIYKIEDKYTSYVDRETNLPIKFEASRREGTYKKDARTIYDRKTNTAYFENFLDHSKKSYPVPEDVMDPVSVLIKMRTGDMDIGKHFVLNIDNNELLYKIHAYIERKEVIKIPRIGDFACYYVQPYAVLNNNKYDKGTISGYISAGPEKMVTFVEAKASLFSKMTATLVSAEKT